MYFLDDLFLPCDECGGKRFQKHVLSATIRGRSIYSVFKMTVSEAKAFFRDSPRLIDKLDMLEKVGLGYLQLGQGSQTLSGGESQRLKIAAELMNQKTKHTLYILDEPTTGLHASEVKLLINLLQNLVNRGNTVVVIEHNIDMLKSVDWLIEMGPGAGEAGGEIVAEGSPEVIAKSKTKTAKFLKKSLNDA
jgi:excinuclease ABC subunit A